MSSSTNGKARGFAAMEPERRRDISRKGGVAAHRKGTAHQWNPVTAREAGRKGGLARGSKEPPAAPQERVGARTDEQKGPTGDPRPAP
jgi:general stress protein YciG